jgi:hypothetical protein
MALVWNLFVVGSTVVLLVGSLEMSLLLLAIPFLTLFLAVGWYLAGSWISMRFTRSDVLISRQKLGLKKVLFGFKRMEIAACDPSTEARLVESYSQDDEAVFRVRLNGIDRSLAFGTALSREEKNWLVDEINSFLGMPGGEPIKSNTKGSELTFNSLSPDDLSEESFVYVDEPHPGELVLETPVAPHHPLVVGLVVVLILVGLFWGSLGLWRLWAFAGLVNNIVGWAFVVAAFLPVCGIVVLLSGRTRVTINEREFVTRVGLGPVGYSVRRPSRTAERIRLESTVEDPSNGSIATTVVQVGSSKMLAAWGLVPTCEEVAGLIRHHFDALGIETTEQSVNELETK